MMGGGHRHEGGGTRHKGGGLPLPASLQTAVAYPPRFKPAWAAAAGAAIALTPRPIAHPVVRSIVCVPGREHSTRHSPLVLVRLLSADVQMGCGASKSVQTGASQVAGVSAAAAGTAAKQGRVSEIGSW